MALFDAEKVLSDLKSVCRIISIQRNEDFTTYEIRIELGTHFWTVDHRYSEFHDLNDRLVNQHGLDKSMLPPKKLFGNQSDSFIQRRKSGLETYLQNVIQFYLVESRHLPIILREFLNFQKYEVQGITETLAESFFHYGDSILAAGSLFTMSPLHLSSLTERLKLAEPTYVSESKSKDLGHLLDFASQLVRLHIEGNDALIGRSNLIMNKLPFDLSTFKSVKELQMYNCDMKSLRGVGTIRSSVKQMTVRNSLQNVRDLLLCDLVHWPPEESDLIENQWTGIEKLQLNHNKLQDIDVSMRLLVNVQLVDLSHNQLSEIANLETLSKLSTLDLSCNNFVNLEGLHTKLGNIRSLNLSSNKIFELESLSKLYSLESLDLSQNRIEELSEIRHLSELPCLETLKLINNPVTTAVDYRMKTLVFFATRISEITLDNLVATQKEKDTVAVIHAIKVSKEACKQKFVQNKASKSVNAKTHDVQLTSSGDEGNEAPTTSDKPELLSGIVVKETDHAEAAADVSEFRHQIELIRKKGGDGWLRLFNTMQNINQKEAMATVSEKSADANFGEPLVPDFATNENLILHIEELVGVQFQAQHLFWCILVSTLTGSWFSRLPILLALLPQALFAFNIVSLPKDGHPLLKLSSKWQVDKIKSVSSSPNTFHLKILAVRDNNTISNNFLLLNSSDHIRALIDAMERLLEIEVKRGADDVYASSLVCELAKKVTNVDKSTFDILYHQRVALSWTNPEKSVYHVLLLTKSHFILGQVSFDDVSSFSVLTVMGIRTAFQQFVIKDSIKEAGEETDSVNNFFSSFGYYLLIEDNANNKIDVRFPSKESRDHFLNVFTHIRRN